MIVCVLNYIIVFLTNNIYFNEQVLNISIELFKMENYSFVTEILNRK